MDALESIKSLSPFSFLFFPFVMQSVSDQFAHISNYFLQAIAPPLAVSYAYVWRWGGPKSCC